MRRKLKCIYILHFSYEKMSKSYLNFASIHVYKKRKEEIEFVSSVKEFHMKKIFSTWKKLNHSLIRYRKKLSFQCIVSS